MSKTVKHFEYENIRVNVFFDDSQKIDSIVYFHCTHEKEDKIVSNFTHKNTALAAIDGEDFNNDLSPWRTKTVFNGAGDFEGKADEYISFLEKTVIPDTEKELGFSIKKRGILGYSLAGLFALYFTYKSDIFTCGASVSGSMWFDGFMDFMKENKPKSRIEKFYFSLGNKEKKTKNERMAQVEDCTNEAFEIIKNEGIETVFEINPGNHFNEPEIRILKALNYLKDVL